VSGSIWVAIGREKRACAFAFEAVAWTYC